MKIEKDGKVLYESAVEPKLYRRRVSTGALNRVCHILQFEDYIAFVFEDTGEVHMQKDYDDHHPWFYRPVIEEDNASSSTNKSINRVRTNQQHHNVVKRPCRCK